MNRNLGTQRYSHSFFDWWVERLIILVYRERSDLLNYLIVCALMVLTLTVRLLIAPLNGGLQYVTFFPAVTLAAVIGGFRSGILATLIGICLVDYVFTPPYFSFSIDGIKMAMAGNMVFLIGGIISSFLIEAMHRYRARYSAELDAANVAQLSLQDQQARLNGLVDAAMDGIVSTDENQNIILFNHGAEQIFGYRSDEILGQPLNLLIPQRYRDRHGKHVDAFSKTGVTKRSMNELGHSFGIRANGEEFPFEASISRVNVNGHVNCTAILRDISDRKRAEKLLRDSEERYRALFDHMLDGFAYCQMLYEGDKPCDFVYLSVNSAFSNLTGLNDVTGKKVSEVIPGILKSNPEVIELYGRVAATGAAERFEVYVEQLKIWLFITTYSLEKGYFAAVFENITERKKIEDDLRTAAAAFETQDAIMITDVNANIIKVNQAFTVITGYTPEEVLGKNPRIMNSGLHDKRFFAEMFRKLQEEGFFVGEIWDKRKNGEVYPRWMSITAVRDAQHQTIRYVSTFSDITDRKKNEELVNRMAYYDQLTQLPNRRMLNDRLKQAMATNKRTGVYGAVMFLDLDNFKPLNDTHGHVVGDLLLVEVGRRICSCLREMDTVARFGGDEFVVMLSELNIDEAKSRTEALTVAEKIRSRLAERYILKLQQEDKSESCVEHSCSSSIGVTLFLDHEVGVEDVFKQADAAMYQAKENGRNSIWFYPVDSSELSSHLTH